MQLITAPSKSSQVAEFLKKEIVSKRLLPGEKLQSVRRLADQFNVGRQVVLSAFNFLEREKLIEMKARQGAFVSMNGVLHSSTGVYILAYGINNGNRYFEDLLKITYPPFMKDNYNFVTRVIPYKQMSDIAFEMELERIKVSSGTDVVIIHAACLNRTQIETCLQLPFPVLFVGDFQKSRFPDLKMNQITGDNAGLAQICVDYLSSQGCSHIALVSSSLTYSYAAEFVAAAKVTATTKKVELSVIDFPQGIHSMPDRKRNEIVYNILSDSFPGNFDSVLVSGINFDLFLTNLKRIKAVSHEKLTILSSKNRDNAYAYLEHNNVNMYKKIYSTIENMMKDPTSFKRYTIPANVKIVKNPITMKG